jgi:hypothetical protein
MKLLRVSIVVIPFLTVSVGLRAQDFAPPPPFPPGEATLKAIAERTDKLGNRIMVLRRQGLRDPQLADVEVYLKASLWIVRHQEFYAKEAGDWTLEVLDRGLLRAGQLAQGESPWHSQTGQAVVRGYRSRIDGSVQPYAVTYPADYGRDPRRKWRLDVVLHGRDNSLTEVKFLRQHAGDKPAPKEQDFIQLDIYGRGNNAYRWAGETDAWEAIDNFLATEALFGRGPLLDPGKVVLRGFSMGGAGTWHLGLHRPDRWSVIGPGAGFTTTRGYVKTLPAQLPAHQEACLHIYDAVDYAANAFHVPVVAYGGSDDPQLQAARNIEERLKPLKIPMTLLVAPGLGHQFPAEWRKRAEDEYLKHLVRPRPEYPDKVQFVTYTLRYPRCLWINLLGLERHYDKATVAADRTETGYTIKTGNVRALQLDLPPGPWPGDVAIQIDGQRVEARPYQGAGTNLQVYLDRRDGRWTSILPERLQTDLLRRPWKTPGIQGPIDDAFTESFLCVRGTGKPWHETTARHVEANLKRFQQEWDKYLRGELPVKDDVDVTPADIASRHLILFGDPSSNALIAQVLDGLPLKWTREQLSMAGKTFAAAEHLPALIYPSPLNSQRYVVLNSGHTFRAADFQGTNALLYPRLGDYAVLKAVPTEKDPAAADVVLAGLFDDYWQVGKK